MNKKQLKAIEALGLTVGQVQKSCSEGYVSIEDILSGNYEVSENGDVYNPDYYKDIDGTIYHENNTWWCEYNERYYSEDENSADVVRNNGDIQIWLQEDAEQQCSYYYEYNGRYYEDWGALRCDDLVYTDDTNRIMRDYDAYYCEDSGDWFEYESNMPSYEDEDECYVNEYHSGGYRSKNFTNNPTRFIGFEIEKEDLDVKESMRIYSFKDATDNLWRKERDGSLDCDSGFELISPTFEFCVDKIFEYIRGNQVLIDHINADKSTACGGHIHVSIKDVSGKDLFDSIKGYVPLFYALYHKRSENSFCQAKSSDKLKSDGAKHQAIQVLKDRIEFRIISAVPNVDVLEWRAQLIELILDNPTSCFRTAYENILKMKDFRNHLRKAYPNDEKYTKLKCRIKDMTTKFENVNFNISKFKEQQQKAEEAYNLNRAKAIAEQNIKKLISYMKSGNKVKVRVIATELPKEDWTFIGRVDVPFGVGNVFFVEDFMRGCALKLDKYSEYFPITMFEVVEE